MAELQPFRALHYNPAQVRLNDVLAPPYDVISPEEREELQKRSPYNIIHLILGQKHIGSGEQADAEYAKAGENWRNWQSEGALVEDEAPAFYVYEQQFFHEGDLFTRTGLVAAVHLEAYENGVIFPHEKTFPGPKQDRLRLMETVHANLDSVFGLYDGQSADMSAFLKAAKSQPSLLAGKSPDGQTHTVWEIRDPEAVAEIQNAFASAQIVIADGHHRYETALNYREQQQVAGNDSPSLDYVMMTLCDIRDPGLLVLPTHRLVAGMNGDTPASALGAGLAQIVNVSLSNTFRVENVGSGSHTMSRLESMAKEGRSVYGAYYGEDQGYVLIPKAPAFYRYEEMAHFSEQILERLPEILEVKEIRVSYSHSAAEAVCQVNAGNAWIAFLLQGLPVGEVYEAARNNHLMPEKSTYFYPKLQSGLLMRAL